MRGPVRIRGARATLVAAPPVYAPGGPVLLVTKCQDGRMLDKLEREASRRGAAVSVVARRSPDAAPERWLLGRDYRRTCDFYEGVTTHAP
jgi:hypothetical protein